MKHNYNGKVLNIPDEFIKNAMEYLYLTEDEAIQLYIDDNSKEINNEEQKKLQEFATAKENKVKVVGSGSTPRKQRTVSKKGDTDKETLIQMLFDLLKDNTDNAVITNPTKLIEFDYNSKHYKLDLVKQTKKK